VLKSRLNFGFQKKKMKRYHEQWQIVQDSQIELTSFPVRYQIEQITGYIKLNTTITFSLCISKHLMNAMYKQ